MARHANQKAFSMRRTREVNHPVILRPSWPPLPSTTLLDRGPARRWSTGGGSVKKALGPPRAGQGLRPEERSGTYSDRVRQTPSLSTDEDALSRLWRARLIIAKLISLHAHAQDLALIDVQALGLGSVEQFVSRC